MVRESVGVPVDHFTPVLLQRQMWRQSVLCHNGERRTALVEERAMLNRHLVVTRDQNRRFQVGVDQAEQGRVFKAGVAKLMREVASR